MLLHYSPTLSYTTNSSHRRRLTISPRQQLHRRLSPTDSPRHATNSSHQQLSPTAPPTSLTDRLPTTRSSPTTSHTSPTDTSRRHFSPYYPLIHPIYHHTGHHTPPIHPYTVQSDSFPPRTPQ